MDMRDYYEPKMVMGVIEKTHPLRTFFKTRFFSNSVMFPTDEVSFEFQEKRRMLAPFVNPKLVERDDYSVKTYGTPYISPKRVITNDTLMQKLISESTYNSGLTPADRAARFKPSRGWRRKIFLTFRTQSKVQGLTML